MNGHLTPGFGPLDLELLDEAERSEARAHLERCASCAGDYLLTAEALAQLALALPPSPPSPTVRKRVLESIRSVNRFDMYAAQVAELIDVGLDKARELLAHIDDALVWVTTRAPGVSSYDLPVGPAAASALVGFVRVRPGYTFPDHEHVGEETMLVVQGSAVDSSGTVLRRGALVRKPAGSRHDFTAQSGPDFIYLAVAQEGIVVFGEHMKPGDPRV